MSEELKKESTTKESTVQNKVTVEKKKKTLKLRNIFVFVAIILFALVTAIVFRAEYLKVKEIGEDYITLFEENVRNKEKVGITVFVIVYIITYISNKFIKRGLKKFFDQEKKEMPKLPNKSTAFILALIAAALCSIFITEKFAVFANSAVFGKTDGVFGADISYYMFTLPFIESIFISLMLASIVLIVYTAFYYIIAF